MSCLDLARETLAPLAFLFAFSPAQAPSPEAGAVEVKTRWDGERLLVDTKSGRGPKVSESWSLDAGSGKLMIIKSIEMPNQAPVTFRSSYDRAPGAES